MVTTAINLDIMTLEARRLAVTIADRMGWENSIDEELGALNVTYKAEEDEIFDFIFSEFM